VAAAEAARLAAEEEERVVGELLRTAQEELDELESAMSALRPGAAELQRRELQSLLSTADEQLGQLGTLAGPADAKRGGGMCGSRGGDGGRAGVCGIRQDYCMLACCGLVGRGKQAALTAGSGAAARSEAELEALEAEAQAEADEAEVEADVAGTGASRNVMHRGSVFQPRV
jgi:hypothetical protein